MTAWARLTRGLLATVLGGHPGTRARTALGRRRGGGLYRISYGFWNDVELDQFDFRQFDMQLMGVALHSSTATIVGVDVATGGGEGWRCPRDRGEPGRPWR